jgi:hypothetical protein
MAAAPLLLSPEGPPQSRKAVRAEHLARLIGLFAAKYLPGFVKYARSIVEKRPPAMVALSDRKKNVANARIGKANGRISWIEFGKADQPNGVPAGNSIARTVASARKLKNKAKQCEAFVGGIRRSEDQSSENDRNRQRGR